MKTTRLWAIVSILFSSVLTSNLLAAPVVWETTIGGNGHAYELIQSRMTWKNSYLAAQSLIPPSGFQTGHLVTYSDQAEELFVLSIYENGLNGAWIGYSDEDIEGQWKWIDGTPTNYTNWRDTYPVEPNNENGIEHYAVYSTYRVSSPKWNDLPNNSGYFDSYLVEFEPVPIPGALFLLGSGLLCIVGLKKRLKNNV